MRIKSLLTTFTIVLGLAGWTLLGEGVDWLYKHAASSAAEALPAPKSESIDAVNAAILIDGMADMAADFEKNITEAKKCGDAPLPEGAPAGCRDPRNLLYESQTIIDLCASYQDSLRGLLQGEIVPGVSRRTIFDAVEQKRLAHAFKMAQEPWFRECKPRAPSFDLRLF